MKKVLLNLKDKVKNSEKTFSVAEVAFKIVAERLVVKNDNDLGHTKIIKGRN